MAIRVTQPEEGQQVPVEIIAQSIVEIAAGMARINTSRLNRRAVLVLLQAETKVPQYMIERVLNSISDLEKTYCNAKAKR